MIHLRPVSPFDLELLLHWHEQPHMLTTVPKDDWAWETELNRKPDWRQQLIAEADQHAIGFIQIIDPAREESHYWGDISSGLRAIDIWIGEADYLGKGFGTQMMQLALTRCFNESTVKGVLVDPLVSNTRAHHFYEKTGFHLIKRRRFDDDDCFVYRIDRSDWINKVL